MNLPQWKEYKKKELEEELCERKRPHCTYHRHVMEKIKQNEKKKKTRSELLLYEQKKRKNKMEVHIFWLVGWLAG